MIDGSEWPSAPCSVCVSRSPQRRSGPPSESASSKLPGLGFVGPAGGDEVGSVGRVSELESCREWRNSWMFEQSGRVEGSAWMIARRAARARVETRAPTRSMVGAAHRFCRSLDAVFLRLWDLSFWLCSLFKDPQLGLGLDNSWGRAEWARREPCRGAVEEVGA